MVSPIKVKHKRGRKTKSSQGQGTPFCMSAREHQQSGPDFQQHNEW